MATPVEKSIKAGITGGDSEAQQQQQQFAVSLGKPSLRLRLEAYYSLIAPDLVANQSEWRSRYEQIWDKYGGTHEGERKLATKLAKKYGTTVRFLLASSVTQKAEEENKNNPDEQEVTKRPEEWYELKEEERNSGVVDFTSNKFDPVAALSTNMVNTVEEVNPWIRLEPHILDRVDQCRKHLPLEDPQYRVISNVARKRDQSETDKPKMKAPSCFASIASMHEKGPFSVLHEAFVKRQRIRVLIRYVNGIRGTITGYLVAFDKHMNLILRDVDENYSPRFTGRITEDGTEEVPSNAEIELQRRISGISGIPFSVQSSDDAKSNEELSWTNRERNMRQIMVRGDNVVIVYKADQERSAWPVTAKSPKQSEYRSRSAKIVPPDERVGTPGSLIYAARRRQNRRGRKSDYSSYR